MDIQEQYGTQAQPSTRSYVTERAPERQIEYIDAPRENARLSPSQSGVRQVETVRRIEEIVNERYARSDDPRSLMSIAASEGLVHVEHRNKIEIFPNNPGKFVIWIVRSEAQDPFLTGAIQQCFQDEKLYAKGAVYLVRWLIKSIYSWNASEPITEETIMEMSPELGKLIFERIKEELGKGEPNGSASS